LNRSTPLLHRNLFLFLAALIISSLPALAADAAPKPGKAFGIGSLWVPQGPAPTVDDLVHVPPDNSVDGAIHALVPHPRFPQILYVGAVNGGVWVTFNATAEKPTWIHLTDDQASQAIGALEMDPTDPTYRTLVAGPGVYSAYGDGGDLAGLLRTTDGGLTWKQLTGKGVMMGKSISGLAPRGRIIVASVSFATPLAFSTVGVFRSKDGGNTWTQISQGNGRATGLPGGITYDLASDPMRPKRLFTSVVSADEVGGRNGIYRSDDTGATWTKVSSAEMDALLLSDATVNAELTVGRHNEVYATIANHFVLAAVFRSGDGGNTWKKMDLPVTIEDGVPIGINPGGQADFHLSIVADPTNANIVYIGGDRQPARNEADDNATRAIFPNSIGSTGFWGRLFRGDASKPAGSQWVHLTHSNTLGAPGGGTASGSAPHVDSRDMAFDAAGNLLEVDDGGIYKRTQPRSNQGDWFSLIGNLQVAEMHDVAYDRNTRTLFAGVQDDDVTAQNKPGSLDWSPLLYGDGGDMNVDDTSTPGISMRLSSVNRLRNFNRSFWDSDNNFLDVEFVPATVLDGGDPLVNQFYTPVRMSGGDPKRIVIGGANGVYESFDVGDTLKEIGPGIRINSLGYEGVAYGVPGNPNALYVGGSDDPHVFPGHKLWVRTAAPPAPLVRSVSYPGGLPIRTIAINPRNANHAVVIDDLNVYQTHDAGVTWTNITGNLPSFSPSVLRYAVFTNTPYGSALVVGANRGIYIATGRSGFTTWNRLGSLLPTAPVLDLRYDPKSDRLTAGLLGRGAFTLDNVGAAVVLAN
jgi:photosystem II stability/assembly factor-like uncharacterized protein